MEQITQDQSVDLNFKCCFFGAIRGRNKDGKEVGIISEVYSHRNNFSHKDFECSFYSSVLQSTKGQTIDNFDDPEVWKLSQPAEAFNRRDEVIKQYENESRIIDFCDVGEVNC